MKKGAGWRLAENIGYAISDGFGEVVDFLMEHPLVTMLVRVILCVAASVATTYLLVFLRTAGYIP